MDHVLATEIGNHYRPEYLQVSLKKKRGLLGRLMRWVDKNQRETAAQTGINFLTMGSGLSGLGGLSITVMAATLAGLPGVIGFAGAFCGWALFSSAVEHGGRQVQASAEEELQKDLANGTLENRYKNEVHIKDEKKKPYAKKLSAYEQALSDLALTPVFSKSLKQNAHKSFARRT